MAESQNKECAALDMEDPATLPRVRLVDCSNDIGMCMTGGMAETYFERLLAIPHTVDSVIHVLVSLLIE